MKNKVIKEENPNDLIVSINKFKSDNKDIVIVNEVRFYDRINSSKGQTCVISYYDE